MQKKRFVLAALLSVVMVYAMDDHRDLGDTTPPKGSPALRFAPVPVKRSGNMSPLTLPADASRRSPFTIQEERGHVAGRGLSPAPSPGGLCSITPTPPSSASSSPQSSPEQLTADGSPSKKILTGEERKKAHQKFRGVTPKPQGIPPAEDSPVMPLSAASSAPRPVPRPIAAAASYAVRTHIRNPEDPVFSHSAASPFSSGAVSSSLSVPEHLLPQDPENKKQS